MHWALSVVGHAFSATFMPGAGHKKVIVIDRQKKSASLPKSNFSIHADVFDVQNVLGRTGAPLRTLKTFKVDFCSHWDFSFSLRFLCVR